MATLNFNSTAYAGTTVEVWSQKAIADRREKAVFEYMKDYTNMIIRQDDDGLRETYPSPNQAYTMTYQTESRLLGKGASNQTVLKGKEEKVRKNSFSYNAGFRRNAVANDEYVPNQDISEANYAKKQRELLAEWQAYDKQNQDIARMISGASIKKFGNGAVSDFASVTSSHVLDADTFITLKENLARYNASPVWFSQDMEQKSNSFRGYVMLVDETVAERMLSSDDFSAFIDTFFQGYGYDSPMAKVSYGKKQNMAIIPIEPQVGFGSPLRPTMIVGKDTTLIADSGNRDVEVGLPKWNSDDSAYDDYTNDTNGIIPWTQYFINYCTASGTTSTGVACRIEKYDGSIVTGMTVKVKAGATTDYTVNIVNGSGDDYTPQAGDKIVVLSSLVMGVGAEAYISHQSAPYFSFETEDYGFENGVAINYWEGGVNVKDGQNLSNRIILDFVYSA